MKVKLSNIARHLSYLKVIIFAVIVIMAGSIGAFFYNSSNTGASVPITPLSPSVRAGAAMAYDAKTNQTVFFGGLNPFGGTSNPAQFLGSTWIFNGSTWTKANPKNSPSPRAFASMVYDVRTHQLLLFGGENKPGSSLTALNDTWDWNGSNWVQLNPKTSPSPRAAAAMSLAPISNPNSNQSNSEHLGVILFGGLNSSLTALNDTWEWNGSNWVQLNPTTSPSPRAAAAMSLAPITGQSTIGNCIDGINAGSCGLLLFGGLSSLNLTSGELNDTWEWNGSNWVQLNPITSPPATGGAVMSLAPITSANKSNSSLDAVLFGGFGIGSKDLNDTWEWNGSNWVQQSPASSPSVRGESSIALIPKGTSSANQTAIDNSEGLRVLIFGGLEGPNALNDTWEWNGSNWVQLFDPKLADPSAQAQSINAAPTTSTPPNPDPVTQQNVAGVNPLDPPPAVETPGTTIGPNTVKPVIHQNLVLPGTSTTQPPVEPTATTICTPQELTASITFVNPSMGDSAVTVTISSSSPCIFPAAWPNLRYITTSGQLYPITLNDWGFYVPGSTKFSPKTFSINSVYTAAFVFQMPQPAVPTPGQSLNWPDISVQMQIPGNGNWINVNLNSNSTFLTSWGETGIQNGTAVTPFEPSDVFDPYQG